MADGKVVIDVILDDGTVAKGVANLDKRLGGLKGSSERAAFSIGRIVTALGLVALASKGIDMVKNALDGAISRYDTLNNFPRVLQQMGFDAEETTRAINRLSDGVQGLPTTLDSVAGIAQRIAVMTGDLDGAVETTLALNNAFIASGASQQDAARGLEQYVQMLAKGEVDLQSWRTLQETMGVALNETANAFGFVGRSAQNDLYEALKEGEITFDQFNTKIIELSNAQGGFAERALTASGGIRTAWTNMKTAVVRGVTTIIEAIDRVLEDTPYESIEGIISRIGQVLNFMLVKFADSIPVIAQKMVELKDKAVEIYNTLEPWLPLIKNILLTLGGLTVAVATINTLHNAFMSVRAAIMVVQASFLTLRTAIMLVNSAILMNPIALVVAAVIAAVALIYYYWEPITDFFKNLWASIESVSISIWETIKGAWQSTVDWFKNIWKSIGEFFSDLWTSVKDGALIAWGILVSGVMAIVQPFVNGVTNIFNHMKDGLTMILEGLKQYFTGVWDLIKNIFLGAVLLIINLVTGNFDEMKENAIAILENIKGALNNIWDGIKKIFSGALSAILGFAKGAWENLKANAIKSFNDTKTLIFNIWDAIKRFFTETLVNIWNTVKQKFADIVASVKDQMKNARQRVVDGWNNAVQFLKGIDLMQIGKDIIQGLIDGIKSKITAVGDAIKGVTDQITGKIKDILGIASPSKVLFEIGKWTGEGLEDGLFKSRKGVEKAAGDLAKMALPDPKKVLSNLLTIEPRLSASTAAGGGTSTTNNYQRFGDIKLDARDLRHVGDLIDMLSRLQQTSRQGV